MAIAGLLLGMKKKKNKKIGDVIGKNKGKSWLYTGIVKDHFFHSIPKEKMRNAVDIDYLFDIVGSKKTLDVERIMGQKIPLFVKLFNISKKKVEYKDARSKNIMKILKAAVKMLPYVNKGEIIDKMEYCDANLIEPIGIDYLIKKHPLNKIIVIFNGNSNASFMLLHLKKIIEAKIISYMYGNCLFSFYANAEKQNKQDLEKIRGNKNILFLQPPKDTLVFSGTTDKNKLLKTYQLGIKQAKLINGFLKNN